MEQKALIFGEDCINKNTFHKNKIPISIDRVDIEKIVLFKIDSYGNKGSFKYLIGCTQEDRDFPFSSTTMHKISSNKYLCFLKHIHKTCYKNTTKYGIRLVIY